MYTEINTKYRLYISNRLLIMLFLVASMIVVGGLTRLTDSGLSITGIVLGNVTIEVTPPEAAAILADLKLSLCLSPGSQI